VLVRGSAEIVHTGEEHEHAVQLLREKYAQYRQIDRNSVTRSICQQRLG
jgi:IS4 transposase